MPQVTGTSENEEGTEVTVSYDDDTKYVVAKSEVEGKDWVTQGEIALKKGKKVV